MPQHIVSIPVNLKFTSSQNSDDQPVRSQYHLTQDILSTALSLFWVIHHTADSTKTDINFPFYIERELALEYVSLLGMAVCASASESLEKLYDEKMGGKRNG